MAEGVREYGAEEDSFDCACRGKRGSGEDCITLSLMICTPHQIFGGDEIRGRHVTLLVERRDEYRFFAGETRGKAGTWKTWA